MTYDQTTNSMDDDRWHTCHFCGTDVCDGLEHDGTRHWLSDCRSDLVEHEIGPDCTWSFRRLPITRADGSILEPLPENHTCYAYEDDNQPNPGRVWTNEHTHFYPDGPM